jgi:hypothetical protein
LGNMEDFSTEKLPLLIETMRHAAAKCENFN